MSEPVTDVDLRERLRNYAMGELRQAIHLSRRFNEQDLGMPDNVARSILRRLLSQLMTDLETDT